MNPILFSFMAEGLQMKNAKRAPFWIPAGLNHRTVFHINIPGVFACAFFATLYLFCFSVPL